MFFCYFFGWSFLFSKFVLLSDPFYINGKSCPIGPQWGKTWGSVGVASAHFWAFSKEISENGKTRSVFFLETTRMDLNELLKHSGGVNTRNYVSLPHPNWQKSHGLMWVNHTSLSCFNCQKNLTFEMGCRSDISLSILPPGGSKSHFNYSYTCL